MTLSGEVTFQSVDGSVICATVNGTTSELLALFLPKSTAVLSSVDGIQSNRVHCEISDGGP
jgi:hypothetical protein